MHYFLNVRGNAINHIFGATSMVSTIHQIRLCNLYCFFPACSPPVSQQSSML